MSRLNMYAAMYSTSADSEDPLGHQLFHSGLSAKIHSEASEIAETLGFGSELLHELGNSKTQHKYHVIESNVGDDSNLTTDSLLYAIASIPVARVISFIKLSLKDVGISRRVANYAEGWLLTPISAESSFEAVTRHNRTFGVPFTLDPVKLKLLSAVRKQSSEEMDLESKLSHLSEIAAWTNPNWFTYDFHQMALILANCVFDFCDARTFPFLFKTEGGCGGLPPYGNLATAYSALHYYTRGRSRRAITGVMQESLLVNNGEMAPKDTFFLRASHLANAGDTAWAHYETAYRTLLDKDRLTRAEARDALRQYTGVELPKDILRMGFEVNPESFTVGSAISKLRQSGHLMTEIDVQLLQQKLEKEQGVFGKKPIGELLVEQEEIQKTFRAQSWKVLSRLYEGDDRVRRRIDARLGSVPQGFEAFAAVADRYYTMRGDHHAEFSSFFYTDSIRIFKTKDIENHFGVKRNSLQEDFSQTTFIRKWKPLPEENRKTAWANARVEAWLDSGSLNELLKGPLPTDLGTDDARIIKGIRDLTPREGVTGIACIIISDDAGLMRTAAATLKGKQFKQGVSAAVVQIRINDYVGLCLSGVREAYECARYGTSTQQPRLFEVPVYNSLLERKCLLPAKTVNSILERFPGQWRRRVDFKVFYDIANMEKQLEYMVLDKTTMSVTRFSGGCLERRTLLSMPQSKSWAETPIDQIARWPDFTIGARRRLYPKDIRLEPQVVVYDPGEMASAKRIHDWLGKSS